MDKKYYVKWAQIRKNYDISFEGINPWLRENYGNICTRELVFNDWEGNNQLSVSSRWMVPVKMIKIIVDAAKDHQATVNDGTYQQTAEEDEESEEPSEEYEEDGSEQSESENLSEEIEKIDRENKRMVKELEDYLATPFPLIARE